MHSCEITVVRAKRIFFFLPSPPPREQLEFYAACRSFLAAFLEDCSSRAKPRDIVISIRGSSARNGFGVRNIVMLENGLFVSDVLTAPFFSRRER
jgi:hypothetical protein